MTTLATPLPTTPEPSRFSRGQSWYNRRTWLINKLVMGFCIFAAAVTILALFLIFGYILYKGVTSLDVAFFTEDPIARVEGGRTGMQNCIIGTIMLIAMAGCVGIPIGMLCGIYLAEYAKDNPFNHAIRLVIDVLAGVPSIIVGVLAYEIVIVQHHYPSWFPASYPALLGFLPRAGEEMGFTGFGFSAWAGALALGFMMCPIIAKTTEEMLKLVPKAMREASTGLGASKFQTLFRVVIPTASSGIITGVMLASARIAGETAPLLFTVMGSSHPVFNSTFPFIHFERLREPFPSLTVQIYNYATSADSDWRRQAWAGLLVLIVIVLVLNVLVRMASSRKKFKMA